MYSPIMLILFLAVAGITEVPRVAAHVPLGARVRFTTTARPARLAGVLTGADRDSLRIALYGGADTVVVARADVRDFEHRRAASPHSTSSGAAKGLALGAVAVIGAALLDNGYAAAGVLIIGVPLCLVVGAIVGRSNARGTWDRVALDRSWIGDTPPTATAPQEPSPAP